MGFPVDVGRNWKREELEATVEQGPHKLALVDDAIAQIQFEAREKAAQGFTNIYTWEELKKSLPPALKLSPLAMISHKLQKYRAILDLLFELLLAGHRLSYVNDTTKNMAMMKAMDQIRSVPLRLIEALASAPVEGGDIIMSKLYRKTDSVEWYVPRAMSVTFHTYFQITLANQPI